MTGVESLTGRFVGLGVVKVGAVGLLTVEVSTDGLAVAREVVGL